MPRRSAPWRVGALPDDVRTTVERARRALGDRRATPNLVWLSALSGAHRRQVTSVLGELERLLPVEEEIRHRHLAAGRESYAQLRAPFELYCLVRLLRPAHVVETGVSSGVSSAHILAALRRNHEGRLHSIDLPTRQRGPTLGAGESVTALPPGKSSGWAVPERLRPRWDLRIGPSQEILPSLVREVGSIGLFLHDGLHTPTQLAFELATVRPALAPSAVVLADNTAWTGDAFPRFARELGVPIVRRGRGDLLGVRLPARPPEL
ncbi:MAG TPA: class I SAM-dependent methyltransferase [Thermoplasmata archaeon]|nr:class I SAM-dependent methyltransferase [Thermoplasmata archaeon]